MAATRRLAAPFPRDIVFPRANHRVSETALSATRFRSCVATDWKPKRTSSVHVNIVPSCGPSSSRSCEPDSVLTSVHRPGHSNLLASGRLIATENVTKRRAYRSKVTSMTPPSLPFKTEPVTTGTSRPVVCTADAWDREAQFKENRRTSLPGKRPSSNSRLPVTTSSLKRSREDRAYGPQRSEFGCSPISTRQSVTQALIGDESSRSCSCSGYYRIPRHSMAVQATTPSWDPATVADDVQYPLGKQDFCSDEFFHSDEDFI